MCMHVPFPCYLIHLICLLNEVLYLLHSEYHWFFLLLLLYISNVIVAKASVHFGMANGTTKYELSDDRGYTWTTSALVQRGLAARGMINNTYMHPSHSTYPTIS